MEAADGGVIFLDEISNLSVRLQRKLLAGVAGARGEENWRNAAAQNQYSGHCGNKQGPAQAVNLGKFRNDLYFRLTPWKLVCRRCENGKGDIELLLEYFLEKICTSEGGRSKNFSQEAKTILLNYAYPGNVRELKNVVEGSYFSTPGDSIDVGHIPTQVRKSGGGFNSWEVAPAAWRVYKGIRDGSGKFYHLVKKPFLERQIGSGQVRQIIHLALAETRGRYRDAFRLLGISSANMPS